MTPDRDPHGSSPSIWALTSERECPVSLPMAPGVLWGRLGMWGGETFLRNSPQGQDPKNRPSDASRRPTCTSPPPDPNQPVHSWRDLTRLQVTPRTQRNRNRGHNACGASHGVVRLRADVSAQRARCPPALLRDLQLRQPADAPICGAAGAERVCRSRPSRR